MSRANPTLIGNIVILAHSGVSLSAIAKATGIKPGRIASIMATYQIAHPGRRIYTPWTKAQKAQIAAEVTRHLQEGKIKAAAYKETATAFNTTPDAIRSVYRRFI